MTFYSVRMSDSSDPSLPSSPAEVKVETTTNPVISTTYFLPETTERLTRSKVQN